MSDLMSILKSAINEEALASIAQQIGATPQATRGAVNTALPVVVGMVANQCQSKQGCESLAQAALGSVMGGSGGSAGSQILGSLLGGSGGSKAGLAQAGASLLGGFLKK